MRLNLITKVNTCFALVLLVLSLIGLIVYWSADRLIKTSEQAIAGIQGEERVLSGQRAQRFRSKAQHTLVLIMGGGLLAVAATAAALILINREIRERSQAEGELQIAKERLYSILTSLDEVVWSLSPKTYGLLYLNPAAEQLYGRKVADYFTDKVISHK